MILLDIRKQSKTNRKKNERLKRATWNNVFDYVLSYAIIVIITYVLYRFRAYCRWSFRNCCMKITLYKIFQFAIVCSVEASPAWNVSRQFPGETVWNAEIHFRNKTHSSNVWYLVTWQITYKFTICHNEKMSIRYSGNVIIRSSTFSLKSIWPTRSLNFHDG